MATFFMIHILFFIVHNKMYANVTVPCVADGRIAVSLADWEYTLKIARISSGSTNSALAHPSS